VHIPDLNVLLYAVDEESPHHEPSRRWLDLALAGTDTVGFAWLVLVGFLRISTRSDVFPIPLTVGQAVGVVETWMSSPFAVEVSPTPRHLVVLGELLSRTGTAGNATNDAHLATLAIEYRADVCTFDRGLGRFPGVRVTVPH
jgi:toxin-antitoxin system PIN domain toxin